MKEKATMYDYARMCMAHDVCDNCALGREQSNDIKCGEYLALEPDKANEIILKWCKEHPVETRQDRFLKMFPKAGTNSEGRISICPNSIEYDYRKGCANMSCVRCRDEYWLAEVEENE